MNKGFRRLCRTNAPSGVLWPAPFAAPLAALVAGVVWAASAGPAVADIEATLEARLRAADLGDTRVSLYLVDLDTGEALAQVAPDTRMIPASNMKLVTTAAALVHLGPDFVFRTELRLVPAADGVSRPTLVVHGDGDPAFADPDILAQHGFSVEDLLDLWADAVADTGVTRFEALLIDDRVFDRGFTHPGWPEDQLVYRWCAPVAGVNFYQNVLDVLPRPTRSGQAPLVALFPPEAASFLETSNRASTGKTDSFWISRDGPGGLTFHGTVKNRRSAPVQVAVVDPPMFFGRVFAERLAARGIAVGSVDRPDADAELPPATVLHRMQTTLPLVLERTNQDSQNMFAEALFKRVGRHVTGRPGGFDNGTAAVRIAMQRLMGPRASVLEVADGSGMSRDNRVTARFLVDLLRTMHEHPDPRVAAAFRDSLAEGGQSGTLRKRFRSLEDAEVLAKSGYLRGVSALSGYLTLDPVGNEPPRRVAFAMLFNGFAPPLTNARMKRLQEDFLAQVHAAYAPKAHLGG